MKNTDSYISKRDWHIVTVFFVFVFVGINIGLYLYSGMIREKFVEDLSSDLNGSSVQVIHNVEKQVAADEATVSSLAQVIGDAYSDNIIAPQAINTIKSATEANGYKRIGIVIPDGTTRSSDDINISVAQRAYFKNALDGHMYMEGINVDMSDGEYISTFSTPIIYNGQILGVLFASRPTSELVELLKADGINGESYIIRENGEIMVTTNEDIEVVADEKSNIYSLMSFGSKNSATNAEYVKSAIKNKDSGYIRFADKNRYVYYTPMGIHDLYLVRSIDGSSIANKTESLIKYTSVLAFCIFVCFFVFLICFILIQKKSRKYLEKIAFTDELTGISNMANFQRTVSGKLNGNASGLYAFVHFDVDKFKIINETFGFEVGNRVLKYIGNKMGEYNDFFIDYARTNTDNFVALIKYNDREEMAEKIQKFFDDIRVGCVSDTGDKYEVSLTMGLYEVFDKSRGIKAMMEKANIARESIKGYHKSNFGFYNDEMRKNLVREKQMEDDMYVALEKNEFVVYYQPKHEIKSKKLIGSEALVRWIHPINGMISPMKFIPLFEKNGFIIKLDEYVFEKACQDIRKWLDEGFEVLPVSVNFSKVHLYDNDFVDKYKEIMDKYNLGAEYLELEITENLELDSLEALLSTVYKLNQIGFKVSMDDFGSGYSSLNMLKDVPVNCIKLDRIFLNDTMDNIKGKQIIEAIVTLSKKMGITVVAEGVETEEQLAFLREIDCEIAQGYYFDRPLTREDFEMKMGKVVA